MKDDDDILSEPTQKTVARTLKAGTWVGLSIAFVVVLTNILFTVAPSPALCSGCHEMRDEYKSWRRSTHQDVPCHRCHQKPGALGQGAQRLRLLSMVFAKVTGVYQRPIMARVPNNICLSCHMKEIQRTVEKVGQVRMSHKEPLEAGWSCGMCHNSVVHKQAVPVKNIASMDKCITCHVEEGASTNCLYCHVETPKLASSSGAPLRIAHGKNWERTHPLLGSEMCPVCHSRSYCSRCHGVKEMPHPEEWLATHGPIAVTDMKKCYQCHHEAFCVQCHQAQMPHPEDWLQIHSSDKGAEEEIPCLQCHMRRGCTECHDQHIHPLSLEKFRNITDRNQKGPWPGLSN